MKKVIALCLLLSSSFYINAVPNIVNEQNLKIYHCQLETNRLGAPRYQDHRIYSGNLVINDLLDSDDEIAATYLTLSPHSDYDYEARIYFNRYQRNNEIIGAMMLNKKGTTNFDNVADTEITDNELKHINYFDNNTGSQYDLTCYYRN